MRRRNFLAMLGAAFIPSKLIASLSKNNSVTDQEMARMLHENGGLVYNKNEQEYVLGKSFVKNHMTDYSEFVNNKIIEKKRFAFGKTIETILIDMESYSFASVGWIPQHPRHYDSTKNWFESYWERRNGEWICIGKTAEGYKHPLNESRRYYFS